MYPLYHVTYALQSFKLLYVKRFKGRCIFQKIHIRLDFNHGVKVTLNAVHYPLNHVTFSYRYIQRLSRSYIYKKIYDLTFDLEIGVKVTQKCCPVRFKSSVKFDVVMANGLGYIDKNITF